MENVRHHLRFRCIQNANLNILIFGREDKVSPSYLIFNSILLLEKMFSKGPEHYLSPLRGEDFGGSFRFQAERIGDQSLLTEF